MDEILRMRRISPPEKSQAPDSIQVFGKEDEIQRLRLFASLDSASRRSLTCFPLCVAAFFPPSAAHASCQLRCPAPAICRALLRPASFPPFAGPTSRYALTCSPPRARPVVPHTPAIPRPPRRPAHAPPFRARPAAPRTSRRLPRPVAQRCPLARIAAERAEGSPSSPESAQINSNFPYLVKIFLDGLRFTSYLSQLHFFADSRILLKEERPRGPRKNR